MATNRSQYHKNVFGKGMNKDLGPTSVPSDMYIDALNGETKHVGYVIGQEWWTFYTLTEWVK